jgi:hypothetical protein
MARKNLDHCFFCGKGVRYVKRLFEGFQAAICESCILDANNKFFCGFDSEQLYNLPRYSNGVYEYLKESHDEIALIHKQVSEILSQRKYDLGFFFMQKLELYHSRAYFNEAVKLFQKNKQIKELRNVFKSIIGELFEIFEMPDDFIKNSGFEKNQIEIKRERIIKKINQYPDEKKRQLFNCFYLIGLQDCINKETNTFELTNTRFEKIIEQLDMMKKK